MRPSPGCTVRQTRFTSSAQASLFPSASVQRTSRCRTICWQGGSNRFMRCTTQRRLSSPESESGQYCWTSASHFISSICLARLSRGADTPPRVATDSASLAPADGLMQWKDEFRSWRRRFQQVLPSSSSSPVAVISECLHESRLLRGEESSARLFTDSLG